MLTQLFYQLPFYILLATAIILLTFFSRPYWLKLNRIITYLALLTAFVVSLFVGLPQLKIENNALSNSTVSLLSEFQADAPNNLLLINEGLESSLLLQPNDNNSSFSERYDVDNLSRNYLNHIYKPDSYGFIYSLLILIVALIVLSLFHRQAIPSATKNIAINIAILASTSGALLILYTSHLILFYLSVELMTIPLLVLISFSSNGRFSLAKAMNYWIISCSGSAVFLLGFALYYSGTHELTFSEINLTIAINEPLSPLTLTGLLLLMVSLLFKIGFIPVHAYMLNLVSSLTYPMILFFLAAINLVFFCCLSRIFLMSPTISNQIIQWIIIIIASISILWGNVGALYQKRIKTLLGYFALSLFGYLLIPLITVQQQIYVMETLWIAIISNTLTFILLFSVLTLESIDQNRASLTISNLQGLFFIRPLRSFFLIIGFFSLASVPLTLNFMSHFFMVMLAVSAELWLIVILIVFSTITGLLICLRLIFNLFKTNRTNHSTLALQTVAPKNRSWCATLRINEIIIWLAVLAIVLLGVFPQWILTLAEFASL